MGRFWFKPRVGPSSLFDLVGCGATGAATAYMVVSDSPVWLIPGFLMVWGITVLGIAGEQRYVQ